jgi:hypothetical protein
MQRNGGRDMDEFFDFADEMPVDEFLAEIEQDAQTALDAHEED